MPIQGPQWTEFLACPVCYNGFNNQGREPVSLGCGHSICKSCLSRLSKQSCPFDQTEVKKDIDDLPYNYALLQLVGEDPPETLKVNIHEVEENHAHFEGARKCIECLGSFLAPLVNNNAAGTVHTTTACAARATSVNGASVAASSSCSNGSNSSGVLTRPMQRKLVTLVNCQLAEEEGRCRALRAARSLGERAVKELILLHQNPQQLSANLWSAVRMRGCQFLGPAMQEEVLRLILLALEEGNALCRKVLVLYVVQQMESQFTQASKTSIGHVVQLLYRASCFKVTKREGDSSLLQLQERYRTYSALRKEHDAQIVQIATEAGLHISPEQWSALLYGDDGHKSHMQSIIDKLQSPASFGTSIQELIIALQRTGDPANLQRLRTHLELLANIDPNPEGPAPSWSDLSKVMDALKIVVYGLVDFMQNHSAKVKGSMEPQQPVNSKYKTHMCRDIVKKGSCPRGTSCSFAHTNEELERYGRRRKNVKPKPGGPFTPNRNGSSSSPETVDAGDKASSNGLDTSTSDKECADALPEEGSSGFRRVTRESQPNVLIHEVPSGIRNMPICNPTQYQATVNGTYAPSFTFSHAVADRTSGGPPPLDYVHAPPIPNGGLPNGYYPPAQPPPVNGIGGSFGRPEQIPSPGMPQSIAVNRDIYYSSQSDVSPFYDGRQRTDSFTTSVINNPFIPQYPCLNDRYTAMVPQYHSRVPYNQNLPLYGSQGGPDGFASYSSSYYPMDSRTKGGRMPEGASSTINSGSSNYGSLRAKGFREDFGEDSKSKSGWFLNDSSTEPHGKPELLYKFGKLNCLGSCADTSSSSYDYSSDTFSPTSSGSSHQGSPPASQLTEYDSKIWGPYRGGERGSSSLWSSKSQASCWPVADNWKPPELRKSHGSLRDVWQQAQGGNRLQQSYDEDSFTGLNRSLQEDPSNASFDSSAPSIPDNCALDKDDTNRSYDNNPFGLGFMKQQDGKSSEAGANYHWRMTEKEKSPAIEEEFNLMQRATVQTLPKSVPPPPGIKPIGYKGDRYRGPVNSSEATQSGSDQALPESMSNIENILRGTRHQQGGVQYGNYNDLTVHE